MPDDASDFHPVDPASMYSAAIDGLFPAKQINRIWNSEMADVDAIASALGLQRDALVTDNSPATATTARI